MVLRKWTFCTKSPAALHRQILSTLSLTASLSLSLQSFPATPASSMCWTKTNSSYAHRRTHTQTWWINSAFNLDKGITGWVAEHREPVAISSNASNDPRFKPFKNLPEDHFEAMLCTPILCASKVVGVINLQHRLTYKHSTNEVRLLSMLGFLVGAEIERARLESENVELAGRLETRKAVDRAKGILQRDLIAERGRGLSRHANGKPAAPQVHATREIAEAGKSLAGRRL
jgi:GAF domain-containing protein